MTKGELLYEGKAKKVFRTDDENRCIVSYKDDATAFNGAKKGTIRGKGAINNRVTNRLMKLIEEKGIPTHFVEQISETDTVVKKVVIVPLEVIVRNIAAGSLSKRLGIPEGTPLRSTVLEFCYKNDELGDPLVNDWHILAMDLASKEDLAVIADYAQRINHILGELLEDVHISLIDFKLEFGKLPSGEIVLADEISPDTCRLWDTRTGEKLDKDRFRRDLGGVEDAYAEVFDRLVGGA
ncbi:MAG: phosphoribosylaminoimidazolesuccinocarboxamide synthase [Treponema sp.]|jgi:phosphoribosylaminoimidazole-succinocarboxamide synthase|nr:phosphoribosylaminoimidazolesuccinocarboxamide synthase [Treponema sp.]